MGLDPTTSPDICPGYSMTLQQCICPKGDALSEESELSADAPESDGPTSGNISEPDSPERKSPLVISFSPQPANCFGYAIVFLLFYSVIM